VHAGNSTGSDTRPADVYVSTAGHPAFPSYATLYDRHALVYLDGMLPNQSCMVDQETDMVVGHREPADILLSYNQFDLPDSSHSLCPSGQSEQVWCSFLALARHTTSHIRQEL
jgi:hypothetical protein